MTDTNTLYKQYEQVLQRAADLRYAAAVLEWDHEVYMPENGANFRGQQLATLSAMAHEMTTSAAYGAILNELKQATLLTDEQAANVRLSTEDYEKNRKLPASFVEELSRHTVNCYNAWAEARKKKDFSIYEPFLAKMIDLKRQQAEMYGYGDRPYDALLDEYEKGMTTALLETVFTKVKTDLPPLLAAIKTHEQVSDTCFNQYYPKELQWQFSLDVLNKMGFDFTSGRQDYSAHPFTTSFSPQDVRLTTRVDENNFASLFWSSVHEGGHGIYEQGLPAAQYGLPLGSAASLGIHESQSRFWENCLGRGRAFWSHFYPVLSATFPDQLKAVTPEQWYKAMNKVEPSFIRTEADELTYHFHVLIRFEMEKAIFEQTVQVKDLPALWNSLYQQYLGITPPDDAAGILQDVHWSHGSFGYFPTYSLGSFYAAQLYNKMTLDIEGMEQMIEHGNFSAIIEWLRHNIHQYGRRYTSEELCERATGEKLNIDYFLQYAKNKYSFIYR